ncbi:MAG: DUF1295 domain-containing protein [Methylophilaceae bacterium]
MLNWTIYTYCLMSIALFAFAGWALSLVRSNVTHVDSMWSLFFLLTACASAFFVSGLSLRATIVLCLVTLWALRLCVYLTWRNWGSHEDHRYLQIRQNNQPRFWLKSLYIVFGLQAVLAWLISISLYAAIDASAPLNTLDYLAIALFLLGFIWEVLADSQLTAFKAKPENTGKVLDTGVWRYSRHPNYFGECCIWWGFYFFALATGAWWAMISPVLMTLLLLKVSGVSLLEKTISERRPGYANYMKNTNAFFPGAPKD